MTLHLKLAVLGLGVALASCQGTDSAPAAGGPEPVLGTLTRVDSLNGLPGIRLGRPFTDFNDLVDGGSTGVLSVYKLGPESRIQSPWFAENRALVPGQFVSFTGGKLVNIQLVAYSAAGQEALRQQATRLFGPAKRVGNRLDWNGTVAGAVLSAQQIGGQPALVLEVVSMDAAR